MGLFNKYRCKHEWEEVNRTFTEPNYTVTGIKGVSEQVFERILHGFTNIELKCKHCGLIHVNQTIGKV